LPEERGDIAAARAANSLKLNGAEAGYQGNQVFAIFFADSGEFEAHALAFAGMPDGGVCADDTVLNEEMEVSDGTDFFGLFRLDEGSADAKVADASDIVAALTAEVDPDVRRIQDAARDSFRGNRCRQRMKNASHARPPGYTNQSK
jgi:hypothetical protein